VVITDRMISDNKYLEELFAPFGRKAGISGRDMSLIYTPQIIASAIDIPVNLLMTDLGSRLVNAILGIGSALAVATGSVKGETAAELSEMASYWLTSLYVPAPHSPVIASEVVSFVSGLMNGNLQQALNAIWKGPAHAQNELIAYTGMLNPASYQTGVNTPLISGSSSSTGTSSMNSVSNKSVTISSTPATSMIDPSPRTANQKALSLVV